MKIILSLTARFILSVTLHGFRLKTFSALIVLLFMSAVVSGQLFHEDLSRDSKLTFDEIVKKTELHYDKIGRGKGNGYKQYQRWKYWAQRSLDQFGKVRSDVNALNQYNRFESQNRTTQRTLTSSYEELGPQISTITSSWSSGLGRVSAIGLDANDDNHIIIGSPGGGIWKTTDYGNNWTPLFDDQLMMDVFALEISYADPDVYFAGLSGGLMKSTDGGAVWRIVNGIIDDPILSDPYFNTITMHPTDPNIVFAVDQNSGRVYKSINEGDDFYEVLDHTSSMYDLEFQPGNPLVMYASGRGAVYRSNDSGESFNEVVTVPWVGTDNNAMMMAVTPAAPNNIYVIEETGGGFNALYLSTTSGLTWATITDNTCNCQNYFGWRIDEDGGQAPRDMDIVVSPVNQNIIHIAGVDSYNSTDLGQNWNQTTSWNAPNAANFIHADVDLLIYDNNRIVAGTDGGIYFSTNEGNTYTDISSGLGIRQFYRIGASETDIDRVSGGSQDNGTGTLVSDVWFDWLGADGMETFIDWNNADIIYGTSQYGKLYRSIDGGQTRATITTPGSAERGNWVTPFEQDPVNPNTIYTARLQVWRSDNGGTTWDSISTFTGGLIEELKIAPSDNNVIYVANGNQLLYTNDGGTNWNSSLTPSGFINYIAVHPSDPNRLALAVSGSVARVYESTDGALSWTDITENIPAGIAIECVVYEQEVNGGLFCGGNPGIFYTPTTSSADWEDSSINLPKVRVKELEIRNETMYVATYGRGLWKYDFVCDGSLTGQACNDLDICTINDVFDANCICAGTFDTSNHPSCGVNDIALINPPTSVLASELVNVTVSYNNSESLDAYVLVRFKSPSGANLGQDFLQVPPGQGTRTLQVPAPADADSGYSYQAQLLLTGTWAGLAEDNILNVTVNGTTNNSITLLSPPITVSANDQINVSVNYNNTESIDAYVLVRFMSPSGANLGQDFAQVAPGQGTQTLLVPTPTTAGTDYSYQAQLLLTGTWAGLAEEIISNVTVESSESNSITLLNPPTTVTANELIDVSVNYSNNESVDAYVLVRFKSPSGDNLEQDFVQVSPGQGTEILQIQAPASAGSGYSYHAQLLLTGTWAGLAEDNLSNITVGAASNNFITLENAPTSVSANDLVDVTVNYNNIGSVDAYVLARFKSPSGDNLGQDFIQVSPGQGTETLQVPTPATAGGGYSYHAQLLETVTWAGLADDNLSNVTVNASGANSITIMNPPTTVLTNEIIDVSLSYNNIESIDAYVLVRFKSPTGDNLEQSLIQVSPGQGSLTLQLQAPANTGSGYSYHAQLLLTGTWAGLAEDNVNNVTVGQNANTSLVTLLSWPDTIEIGGSYDVLVAYELSQNSIIYAQLFDRESPDATGSWNKIGDGWASVNAGSSTVSITDILIDLDVAPSNRLEILLFHPANGTWGDAVPIGDVSVNVPGRSSVLFGDISDSDPSMYMRYYNRDIECNGNTYNGNDVGNGSGFDHTLAPTTKIYRSNWWVNHNWKGPIKSHYGENDQNGKNFWVEWQNLGQCGGGHAEFDIRVEKSNYSDNAVGAGFPSRLGDITEPLDCTFTGQWTAGSSGRGHINMTAWVYNTLDLIPNNNATRCDIIIHAFDNSGDFRKKYEDGFRWSPSGSNTIFHFDKIGTATANGIMYEVLRTMPGGFGEGASYNLIPTSWSRYFMEEFPTSIIQSTIDVNKILKDIIILEAANGPDIVNQQDGSSYQANLLTEDWGLHVMEWTVTGQSGTEEHDPDFPNDFSKKVFIPNSMGRFTFDEYFIPDPCCSNPNIDCPPFIECPEPNDCPDNLTELSQPIITGNKQAKLSIETNGNVPQSENVTYKAGQTVSLLENFEVKSSATFHVIIAPCN